jgi:hypothetical protein
MKWLLIAASILIGASNSVIAQTSTGSPGATTATQYVQKYASPYANVVQPNAEHLGTSPSPFANVVAPGQTPNATTTATLGQANTTTQAVSLQVSSENTTPVITTADENRSESGRFNPVLRTESIPSQPVSPQSEPSPPKASRIQYSEN